MADNGSGDGNQVPPVANNTNGQPDPDPPNGNGGLAINSVRPIVMPTPVMPVRPADVQRDMEAHDQNPNRRPVCDGDPPAGNGNNDDDGGSGRNCGGCCYLFWVLLLIILLLPFGQIFSYFTGIWSTTEPGILIKDPVIDPNPPDPRGPLSPEGCNLINQDKTGRPDIALESLGGLIISTRDTEIVEPRIRTTFFGIAIRAYQPTPPEMIIRHRDQMEPGECWGFKGNKGNVIVQLIKPAIVTGVTLEHIHKNLDPYGKLASAPKDFRIWGLNNYRCLKNAAQIPLGNFTFEPLYAPLQYYKIVTNQNEIFSQVELEVLTNHGSNSTCIYRFRVHGNINRRVADYDDSAETTVETIES